MNWAKFDSEWKLWKWQRSFDIYFWNTKLIKAKLIYVYSFCSDFVLPRSIKAKKILPKFCFKGHFTVNIRTSLDVNQLFFQQIHVYRAIEFVIAVSLNWNVTKKIPVRISCVGRAPPPVRPILNTNSEWGVKGKYS